MADLRKRDWPLRYPHNHHKEVAVAGMHLRKMGASRRFINI